MLSNAYDIGGAQLVTLPVRMVWDEIVLPNQVTQVLRVEPKRPCQLRCRGQARVHVSDSLPRSASAAQDNWKYVHVSGPVICFEESIDYGTQWAVFEPNTGTERPFRHWSRLK